MYNFYSVEIRLQIKIIAYSCAKVPTCFGGILNSGDNNEAKWLRKKGVNVPFFVLFRHNLRS
ncbi:MAG: hypothetical protein EAZ63_07650 [Runella slithyformis]|nr:MAG: hypothetical protein EAZ63_07650 [Runella slithyformis]